LENRGVTQLPLPGFPRSKRPGHRAARLTGIEEFNVPCGKPLNSGGQRRPVARLSSLSAAAAPATFHPTHAEAGELAALAARIARLRRVIVIPRNFTWRN
jgi:hypothetical protein